MDITILSYEEFMKAKARRYVSRKDWSELYASIDKNRRVIVPREKGLVDAVYQHYRRLKQKVHIDYLKEDRTILIYLDE